jgi:transaldolase
MSGLRRAVFLDRDGVLNRAIVRDGRPYAPRTLDELELLPGVAGACDALHAAGYLLVLVTNQPDVSRGAQTIETVRTMNRVLAGQLGLDACEVCAHDDADHCDCRKPKPGLLTKAAKRLGIQLESSFLVGDRWRDIEAGQHAGCRTVFIDRGYNEKRPASSDHASSSLARAVEWILNAACAPAAGTGRETYVTGATMNLRIKIFADGADAGRMRTLALDPRIQGFTTNPTLMRQAGVRDYEAFAREAIRAIPGRPISFEVFSDDLDEMREQALHISSWGENVYVKVPVTNTKGQSAAPLLRSLASRGVKLNVTALMTLDQVRLAADAIANGPPSYISVFAGRIADTGRDPVPIMSAAVEAIRPYPQIEIIWASPRELLNVFQADACGCHIITLTPDLLKKMANIGKDLDDFSLDTVKMFHDDARAAGFTLDAGVTAGLLNLTQALEDVVRPVEQWAPTGH